MLFSEVETNPGKKIEVEIILTAMVEHVNTVEGLMQGVTAQHLARNAKNGKDNHFKAMCKSGNGNSDVTQVSPDLKRARVIKGKNSMKLLKIRAIMQWMI